MKSEPSFASLSPSLLARKGGARPAMRPQHGGLSAMIKPASNADENLEDLGWNDMGEEPDDHVAPVVHLTPEPINEETAKEARELDRKAQQQLDPQPPPPVHKQREEIAQRFEAPVQQPVPSIPPEPEPEAEKALAKPAEKQVPHRRSALDRGKRAAFTLRLDAERHLKLRLASTVRGISAQQFVTQALDDMLGTMPELDAMTAQLKRD